MRLQPLPPPVGGAAHAAAACTACAACAACAAREREDQATRELLSAQALEMREMRAQIAALTEGLGALRERSETWDRTVDGVCDLRSAMHVHMPTHHRDHRRGRGADEARAGSGFARMRNLIFRGRGSEAHQMRRNRVSPAVSPTRAVSSSPPTSPELGPSRPPSLERSRRSGSRDAPNCDREAHDASADRRRVGTLPRIGSGEISEPESDVPLQRILNRQDTAPAALGMRARSEKRMLDSPPGPGEMARPRGTRAPPPAVDAPAAVDKDDPTRPARSSSPLSVSNLSDWNGSLDSTSRGSHRSLLRANTESSITSSRSSRDLERVDSKRKFDWFEDEEAWHSLSKNAYGAFIHVGLQSGLVKAVEMCGSMLMVSCGIQMVIAFQLFVAHQEEVARLQVVCEIPFSLQMSAVMIFVTMMFNHVSEMWRGAQIILASTHHIGGNGGKIGDLEPLSDSEEEEGSQSQQELRSPIVAGSGKRLLIFVVGVVTEIATWGAILMSGVLWIVTSVDVDLVIRSTVAVMFVLNVDEIIYQSCCPATIMEDVEETKYRVPNVLWTRKTRSNVHRKRLRAVEHYFYIYVYLLMLLALAGGLAYVLRGSSSCERFIAF